MQKKDNKNKNNQNKLASNNINFQYITPTFEDKTKN